MTDLTALIDAARDAMISELVAAAACNEADRIAQQRNSEWEASRTATTKAQRALLSAIQDQASAGAA